MCSHIDTMINKEIKEIFKLTRSLKIVVIESGNRLSKEDYILAYVPFEINPTYIQIVNAYGKEQDLAFFITERITECMEITQQVRQ